LGKRRRGICSIWGRPEEYEFYCIRLDMEMLFVAAGVSIIFT
jgi:hypothetical protein